MANSFAEGMRLGSQMWDDAERSKLAKAQEARAAELHSAQMRDNARREQRAVDEDTAVAGLQVYQGGVYDGAQAPWSTMRSSDLGPIPEHGQMDDAGLKPRAANRNEMNQAMQRVALARRDMSAFQGLEKENRANTLDDARKAEFKRLSSMKDAEIAGMFHQSVNDNPDMPAMIDFDPKSRKFMLVSRVPGIPSQSLSRAEMLQHAMGLWEAGQGDYPAGVQAMVATAQAQRALDDKTFERSRQMATGNADVYFKGLGADNDAQRTRNDGARVGLAREAARARADTEKMGNVRQYQDPKTGEIREFYPTTVNGKIEWTEFSRPAGLRPYSPKAAAGPAREVPAEGTLMQSEGGAAWTADGRGGRLSPTGVVPSKRAAVLAKAGFDKPTIESLTWTPDGQYIAWGGLAYDANSPEDMRELRQTLEAHGRDSVAASEMQARGGFTPRYPEDRQLTANRIASDRMNHSLAPPLRPRN